jgi:hypothetical protein
MWDSIATWWHSVPTTGWVFVPMTYIWLKTMVMQWEINELRTELATVRGAIREFSKQARGDRA